MKVRFIKWNTFFLIILFLFANSCLQHKDSLIKKRPEEEKISLFFLDHFKSDRLRIYQNNKIVFDTIFSSNPTTGISFIKQLRYRKISIQFNNDTIFDITGFLDKWNDFLFKKNNNRYELLKAKDTTLISL